MQVTVARSVERRSAGELAACALLGLGLGAAAGFLLSELFGTGGHRRMGRLLKRRPRAAAVRRAQAATLDQMTAALRAEPLLAGEPLELQRRGRGFELRGWVATRAARALAYRVARHAAATADVTNHVLVRGEDDAAPQPSDPAPARPIESPRSA